MADSPARCSLVARLLLGLIRSYQYLAAPLLGERCRFYPSCSGYMSDAVRAFGVWRGLYLGLRRLIRCNPWCEGGHDPVPNRPVRGNRSERY